MNTKKRGRPVGSTKENNKKMFSFRLSAEEAKAVKELLAKMRVKLILLILLFAVCSPVFATVKSTPTIDHRNWQGYGVAQYGTRDDNEYSKEKYKYNYGTIKSKQFYFRNASLISRSCRDMQANGVVYEEPNCRIKENGSYWHNIIGWGQEDYGTVVEYDTRFNLEILRKYVYALDNQNRVAKYKITENKHKNFIKQKLYGSYDSYEQVSYFIQTADKEITEYDMNNNVLSIYRKNKWDRINEYELDGKTLKTYHDTKYIPYLQWSEDNKKIYKKINEFEAKLFDR